MSTRTVSLLWLVATLSFLCGSAHAGHASKIELIDSTVFHDVEYTVDNTYKVITIRGADAERTVSFTQIKQILDSSGRDVTEERLGKFYRPVVEPFSPDKPSPSQSAEPSTEQTSSRASASKTSHYPYQIAFRLEGNFGLPAAEWYEGTKSGIGFGGAITVSVARKVAVRLSASKAGLEADASALLEGMHLIEDDLNFTVTRFFFCAEYYDWPRWRTDGKAMYYVYTGLGAVSHKLTGSALAVDYYTDELWYFYGTGKTETKFATTLGAGGVLFPARQVGFDFGASLDYVFVGGGEYGTAVTGVIIDFKVGLMLLL